MSMYVGIQSAPEVVTILLLPSFMHNLEDRYYDDPPSWSPTVSAQIRALQLNIAILIILTVAIRSPCSPYWSPKVAIGNCEK